MIYDFFAVLKKRISKLNPQFLIKIIAVSLIIFLPIVFAVVSYSRANNDNEKINTEKISVTLYDAQGSKLVSEEGYPEYMRINSLVRIFNSLSSNKTAIPPTQNEKGAIPIVAVIETDSSAERLTCYFSFNKGSSFCVNASGDYFKIHDTDCDRFLESSYSEYIYTESVPPTLLTGDGDIITPSKANWYYKNLSGNLITSSNTETTNEQILYDITGSLSLEFSKLPDSCNIIIYNNDKVVYDGDFFELKEIGVSTYTNISVVLSATYEQSDSKMYCGTLEYSFDVKLNNSPSFTVSSFVSAPGEFITLKCTNIYDPSQLILTPANSLALSHLPVFVINQGVATAVIPFSPYYEHSTFDFSVKYGTSKKNFSIKINQSATKGDAFYITNQDFNYDSLLNYSAATDFAELLSNVGSESAEFNYIRGAFLNPENIGFEKGYLYGDSVIINKNNDLMYYSNGIEYILSENSVNLSIPALNNGIVSSVGYTAQLGQYVIIDHGMGLKTWYCHLSDVNLSEGDLVSKGDSVGKAGNSGIASGNGFYLILSIYNAVLDPDLIIGKTLY